MFGQTPEISDREMQGLTEKAEKVKVKKGLLPAPPPKEEGAFTLPTEEDYAASSKSIRPLPTEKDYFTSSKEVRPLPNYEARTPDIALPTDMAVPEEHSKLIDVANFLVGPDLAIYGASLDENGFHHSWDKAKDEWAEHPILSTITLASQAAMFVMPVYTSLRLGQLGMRAGRGAGTGVLSKIASKAGPRYSKEIAEAGKVISPLSGQDFVVTDIAKKISTKTFPAESITAKAATNYFSQFAGQTLPEAMATEASFLTKMGFVSPKMLITKHGDAATKKLFEKHGDAVVDFIPQEKLGELWTKTSLREKRLIRGQAQRYNSAVRLETKAWINKSIKDMPEIAADVGPLTKAEERVLKFQKNFSSAFWDITQPLSPDKVFEKDYLARVSHFNPPENLAKLMVNPPSAAASRKVMQVILDDYFEGIGKLPDGVRNFTVDQLDDEGKLFYNTITEIASKDQQERLLSGFLTQDELTRFPVHFTTINRGTPGHRVPSLTANRGDSHYVSYNIKRINEQTKEAEDVITYISTFMPRLDDPTFLLDRGKRDYLKTMEALNAGKLFDKADELVLHSIVNDRVLHEAYKMSAETLTNSDWAVPFAKAATRWGDGTTISKLPEDFVDISEYAANHPKIQSTLKRMIGMRYKDDPLKLMEVLGSTDPTLGKLPILRRSIADQLFGPEGIHKATIETHGVIELLSTVLKSGATVLNPPTHFQNIFGNLVLLKQAGINPLSGRAIKFSHELSQEARKFSAIVRQAGDVKSAVGTTAYREWEEYAAKKMLTYGNAEVSVLDILGQGNTTMGRAMRQVISENAWETTEGWHRIEKIWEHTAQRHNANGHVGVATLSKMFMHINDPSIVLDAATGTITKVPDAELSGLKLLYRKTITNNFNRMQKAYVQEDVVPKALAYIHYLDAGFSENAALTEVARRLPMYMTVGRAIGGIRSSGFLPWISFPAEALRITKNNVIDNPLGMWMWMRLPQVLQASAHELGFTGENSTYESVQRAKRGLYPWAQGDETIMYGGESGNAMYGGITGAMAGGVTGAVVGGAPGAIAGAAGGAAVGSIAAARFLDPKGDEMRGMLLNFLPHSSFFKTTSRSPDFGLSSPQDMWAENPFGDPFSILRPLLDIFSGKDQYGNDIPIAGASDTDRHLNFARKAFAGLIGVIVPPIMQRYGFRVATPDTAIWGNEWTSGGAAAALGAFMGWKLGTGVLPTAAVLGIAGWAANVTRLYTDSGIRMDPYGESGQPLQDILLNNFGPVRSYKYSSTIATTQSRKAHELQTDYRGKLRKDLSFKLMNAEFDESKKLLGKIKNTFYNDPEVTSNYDANKKFMAFYKEFLSSFGQPPLVHSIPKEVRQKKLKAATDFFLEQGAINDKKMRDMLLAIRKDAVLKAAKKRETFGHKKPFGEVKF